MEVNLIGPVLNTSYGIVVQCITDALIKRGYKLSLFPINVNSIQTIDPKYNNSIRAAIANSDIFNPNAPSLRIFHQFSLGPHAGRPRINYPIFELDTFRDVEKHHLLTSDILLVCSEWAKQVVLENIKFPVENIHVIPLGVDTEIFTPVEKTYDHPLTFITIGKLEIRKGFDLMLDAFNRAFNETDDVRWLIMWDNPFLQEKEINDWVKLFKESRLGSKIQFVSRLGSHSQLANLIQQQVDYGFYCSRAEGWNLSVLELMACGRTSIVSNCTGHTQFCNDANSLLVEPVGLESAYDGIWFHGVGNWYKFKIDDIVDRLKFAYSDRPKNSVSCRNTANEFTWNASGGLLDAVFQGISTVC